MAMKQDNWKKAIYYGEVFGFLFAWAVGMALALNGAEEEVAKPASQVAQVKGAAPPVR